MMRLLENIYQKNEKIETMTSAWMRWASPPLPPDLESESRPNHSAGPTRPHSVRPHSAACPEDTETERRAECGQSHCPRRVPGKRTIKKNPGVINSTVSLRCFCSLVFYLPAESAPLMLSLSLSALCSSLTPPAPSLPAGLQSPGETKKLHQ